MSDISCENCHTVHELSACAGLTFEDFKDLQSVIVDGIKINFSTPKIVNNYILK